ncbi:MAG: GNAT family N-acetyltransferase [Candidatus Aminicenantes bacterium]|nr:GNAT family N-acetyltransferase [Candidatus Aminicenantes bacterium]
MEQNVLRPSPRYRLFRRQDLPQLEELFKSFAPEIAGLRSPRLYEALVKDAVSNRDIVVIVAEERSSLIGFNMTIIGRRRFIRNFVLGHPLLSLRIAAAKILKPRREPAARLPIGAMSPFVSPGNSGRSWKDASPEIAKILWTGVREEYRGRRISSGIGEHLLRVLKDRGVRRVDVLVDPWNLPSVRLTRALDFRIERRRGRLFGSMDFVKKTEPSPEET